MELLERNGRIEAILLSARNVVRQRLPLSFRGRWWMSDPESVFLVDSLFYHSEADGGCLTLRVCFWLIVCFIIQRQMVDV